MRRPHLDLPLLARLARWRLLVTLPLALGICLLGIAIIESSSEPVEPANKTSDITILQTTTPHSASSPAPEPASNQAADTDTTNAPFTDPANSTDNTGLPTNDTPLQPTDNATAVTSSPCAVCTSYAVDTNPCPNSCPTSPPGSCGNCNDSNTTVNGTKIRISCPMYACGSM